jgi:hypothetical protein
MCPASDKTDADNLVAASLEYQQVLRRKGRMAARIISPFAHWGIVLSAGLKRDPSRDDEGSDRFTDKQVQFFLSACHLLIRESRENELYRIFKALQRLLIPNIREELLRHGSQAAVMFGVHVSCISHVVIVSQRLVAVESRQQRSTLIGHKQYQGCHPEMVSYLEASVQRQYEA